MIRLFHKSYKRWEQNYVKQRGGDSLTRVRKIEGENDRQFSSFRRKSIDDIQDQVGNLSKVCFLPISNALKTEKTS